jgi:hypothetical protein
MNTAILFDTMSIQQYIFGSNRLKDNLGASYIIEQIFEYLSDTNNPFCKDIDIGYIGGGNALIFTTDYRKATEIVRNFTLRNLHEFPGVTLAVAIKENFDRNPANYSKNIKELFGELVANKGIYIPVNTIPSHGITDTCRYSSLSVERIVKYADGPIDLISSSVVTKRNFEDRGRDDERILLKKPELERYSFPNEFDNLGQRKGEDSHIAVVHIDGNGFGEEFRKIDSVEKTKNLSDKVKNAVKEAFQYALIEYSKIEDKIKSIIDIENYLNNILPIRPIVLGGDDVTFVSHGKLGIWFAEKFIEKFNSNYIDEISKTHSFTSCAGIVVIKTKYPFYRAYQIAEELCTNAKARRKKIMEKKNTPSGGNWIDFQLVYSGLGNSLGEVRELQYDVHGFNRPYPVEKIDGIISFSELIDFSFKLKKALPNSKIKDLREMLTRDENTLKVLLNQLIIQHEEFRDEFEKDLYQTDFPLFDMIEILELYPGNLKI